MFASAPKTAHGTNNWLHYALVVSTISTIVLFSGLWTYGMLDPSDGLYAECSREMIALNNYLTPHFNYQPFLEKPILLYWSIIACFNIFGTYPWAARIPAALSGLICIFSVYALTARTLGPRTAALASLILTSMPMFVVIGHLALIDMMVAEFMTVAFLAFFVRLRYGSIKALLLGYASLALLMLAKGPAPVLFVVAPMFIYLALSSGRKDEPWYRMWWRVGLEMHPFAGLIVFSLIAGPWYFAENSATQGAFFQEFFVRQNIGRATGTVNHQEPWNFYVPYAIGGMMPWWPALLFSWRGAKNLWKDRQHRSDTQQLILMCVCWAAFVLLGCSAIKTKLATYVLPAWPPIAILSAITLNAMVRKNQRIKLSASILISGLALIAILISQSATLGFSGGTSLIKTEAIAGMLLLFGGLFGGAAMVAAKKLRQGLSTAVICSALAMAFLVPAGLQFFDDAHDKPFRELLALCTDPNVNVAQFMRDAPSVDFTLKRHVPIYTTKEELHKYVRDSKGKHLLLVTDDVLNFAVAYAPRLRVVARRSKFTLFCIDP